MGDRLTYCDVMETCEECPKYGKDCDGDKRNDDSISRADAIKTVHKYFVEALNNEPHEIDEDGDDVFTDMKSVNALLHHNKMVSKALKALPSAEAEPTVIRSKTLMPTKDFKEWAKRIREENPNAVIIPCDAEVVSAEAKGDLISRQWLLDLYETPKDGDGVDWKVPLEVVRQNIKDAPSAEAVHGEWIDIDDYYRMATCSHCHKVTMFEKWGEYTRPYNYCPNCGAMMVREDGET